MALQKLSGTEVLFLIIRYLSLLTNSGLGENILPSTRLQIGENSIQVRTTSIYFIAILTISGSHFRQQWIWELPM